MKNFKRYPYLLDRADFERTFIFRGQGPGDPGYEAIQTLAEKLYPKSTKEAMREMRLRGIDVSFSNLQKLLREGFIEDAPEVVGGDMQWSARNIDNAICDLAMKDSVLSSVAIAFRVFDIPAGAFYLELLRVEVAFKCHFPWPDESKDPALLLSERGLEMVLVPADGERETRIEFRPVKK